MFEKGIIGIDQGIPCGRWYLTDAGEHRDLDRLDRFGDLHRLVTKSSEPFGRGQR